MNTETMGFGPLSKDTAWEAVKRINELEADSLRKTVPFVELQCAPSRREMEAAKAAAMHLLEFGVGVKLTVHWPFNGTSSWALQTERTRLAFEGAKTK